MSEDNRSIQKFADDMAEAVSHLDLPHGKKELVKAAFKTAMEYAIRQIEPTGGEDERAH